MNLLRTTALILILSFSAWGMDPYKCGKNFEELEYQFGMRDEGVYAATGGDTKYVHSKGPVVAVVEATPDVVRVRQLSVIDHHGRVVRTWDSSWSSKEGAVQGDVRNFMVTFGRETAEVFGDRIIDEKTVEIGTPKKTMEVFGELNGFLPEGMKIRLGYYEPALKDSDVIYIKNLRHKDGPRLPFAGKYPDILHDATYHRAAAALPNESWGHVEKISEAIENFTDALDRSSLESQGVSAQLLAATMRKRFVSDVDVGNGDFSLGLLNGNPNTIWEAGWIQLTHSGRPPKEVLQSMIHFALADILSSSKYSGVELAKVEKVFLDFFARFAASTKSTGFNDRLVMGQEEFFLRILYRLNGIRDAAVKVAAKRKK